MLCRQFRSKIVNYIDSLLLDIANFNKQVSRKAVMRASSNWRGFKDTLARAYPKLNEQIPLALDIDDE